ncbi:hypothetical protein N7492_004588 [Penicillium capsulatum]|uniref:Uncharacterized protein n=1 Tax=Penicillium capsulatum TaxID=69766 RepID=A0A9W9IAR3_9EURO|nr:hypothetical protein N7492_004588 [Penicillium capsulatum]KAJ6136295.1 hypothetical protein N7512_001455 [Penicillium capsulatum]
MQIKSSTGFALLATVALSAAASIPVPSEAGREKRSDPVEPGWMESPGWRYGGTAKDEEFAWAKCSAIDWPYGIGFANGKMVSGNLHPVSDDEDEENNRWCWLTLDGDHRVLRAPDSGDKPDLGPETDDAYPDSKYSCLTYYPYPAKSDRYYHGGCFTVRPLRKPVLQALVLGGYGGIGQDFGSISCRTILHYFIGGNKREERCD